MTRSERAYHLGAAKRWFERVSNYDTVWRSYYEAEVWCHLLFWSGWEL